MQIPLRIGTRDSRLATWQASHVQQLLAGHGFASELIFIRSEGDIDTVTPLYEMGVEGIFTRSLDMALLNGTIDLAVHSMKDVPVVLAKGLKQAAVLKRGSAIDILVYKGKADFLLDDMPAVIASCSVRRIAQWLHRYPHHTMAPLRGNVDTRLEKLGKEEWNGAIFAAAGLERIGLRPPTSVDLDWMLPAPAQGAILVVCRSDDQFTYERAHSLNDTETDTCTKVERDFLHALHAGCTTPVSAWAQIKEGEIWFRGNIASPNGQHQLDIETSAPVQKADSLGREMAIKLLESGKHWVEQALRS